MNERTLQQKAGKTVPHCFFPLLLPTFQHPFTIVDWRNNFLGLVCSSILAPIWHFRDPFWVALVGDSLTPPVLHCRGDVLLEIE
jgi:hypothetical protein